MTETQLKTAAEIVAPKRDETIPGLLRAAAAAHPDKPFVILPDHDGMRLSYADTLSGAERIARALRRSQIGAGMRVAICLPNGPAYVWAWMATLVGGMVDVAGNPGVRGAALAYALDKARVDAVITDDAGLAHLAGVPELAVAPAVFLLGEPGGGTSPRTTMRAPRSFRNSRHGPA